MTISREDLSAFHQFAAAKVDCGEVESLIDLAAEWQATREMQEAAADVRASLDDIEAGRVEPLAEAFADIRRQLGLSQ